jgi:hypothetical protein
MKTDWAKPAANGRTSPPGVELVAPVQAGQAVADSPEDLAFNVAGINERALLVMRSRARLAASEASGSDRDPGELPAAVLGLRDVWCQLPDDALRRLSRTSYLLVDARFTDAAAWREQIAARLAPAATPPRARGGARVVAGGAPGAPGTLQPLGGTAPYATRRQGEASLFDAAGESGFLATLLLYAWHLSRATPVDAAAALGASPQVVEQLASLSLDGVGAMSRCCGDWLTLRWGDQAAVWSGLLAAAVAVDGESLRAERLKGLQRIAGQCMASVRAPHFA